MTREEMCCPPRVSVLPCVEGNLGCMWEQISRVWGNGGRDIDGLG